MYKSFNIQLTVFLFFQEVYLLSKRKYPPLLLQKKKKKSTHAVLFMADYAGRTEKLRLEWNTAPAPLTSAGSYIIRRQSNQQAVHPGEGRRQGDEEKDWRSLLKRKTRWQPFPQARWGLFNQKTGPTEVSSAGLEVWFVFISLPKFEEESN